MNSTTHSFQTPQEELEYYKNKTKDLELDLEETKFALEEFQLSSKELEEELEKEIDSTERRYNEIKIRNEGMRQEVEDWKDKYHQAMKESNVNINQLTKQLEDLKQQTEMFIKKERELEQDNDDLERNGRAAEWSLKEMERKYNVALEKTVMLEGEVTAKAALTEEVQRLKDELRDANVELAVMKSNQAALHGSTASLSSYSGSTSSLAERKSPVIGSHEAMPSIRARLAKNGAARSGTPSGPRHSGVATGSNGMTTPHQNPVKMVQEMVGRVKVFGDAAAPTSSLILDLYSRLDSVITAQQQWITAGITQLFISDQPKSQPKNFFDSSTVASVYERFWNHQLIRSSRKAFTQLETN
ncbi:NADH:ubiquinone oxidoreductase [Gryganskiella cystojenkinii]|nr:NADH:ubiquinone oxidoreductase [Gryganskiella cystojenkinii]